MHCAVLPKPGYKLKKNVENKKENKKIKRKKLKRKI
tara:strand:- start:831 stop:938 length:108 start_codon:yes stop_codon:yes gene_type:complete